MWFNEWDRYAAQWLRNLWPDAVVDDRDVAAVRPNDVVGHARCHFFAGIGGWQYALDLAGWPEDRPIWTASLPCQPFSAAGGHGGVLDQRHLWPAFHRLVAECRPPIIVGEQVASRAGRAWLAGIRTDLEDLGYAVGAADLPAAGVAAPHRRQRLFWVADARVRQREERDAGAHAGRATEPSGFRAPCGLADAKGGGFGADRSASGEPRHTHERGEDRGLADATGQRRRGESQHGGLKGTYGSEPVGSRANRGFDYWSDAEWLVCLDGKARRVGAGIRPLAHGIPRRASKIRAYGNAIIPQVAATFLRAVMTA